MCNNVKFHKVKGHRTRSYVQLDVEFDVDFDASRTLPVVEWKKIALKIVASNMWDQVMQSRMENSTPHKGEQRANCHRLHQF